MLFIYVLILSLSFTLYKYFAALKIHLISLSTLKTTLYCLRKAHETPYLWGMYINKKLEIWGLVQRICEKLDKTGIKMQFLELNNNYHILPLV